MSPTIFRSRGFRFFFFSREEPRLHVHVHHADGEAKFCIEPEIELAQNHGLSSWRITAAKALSGGTRMKSARRGERTFGAEITNISTHGFWILLDGRELFAPFDRFPWFRDAPVGGILRVERPSSNHLY